MPDSPLMSQEEAAAWLKTTTRGLLGYRMKGQLDWHPGTRTYARSQVEALATQIEQEILASHESTMGRQEQTVGGIGRVRPNTPLVLQPHRGAGR